jgi:hypothetical protein
MGGVERDHRRRLDVDLLFIIMYIFSKSKINL